MKELKEALDDIVEKEKIQHNASVTARNAAPVLLQCLIDRKKKNLRSRLVGPIAKTAAVKPYALPDSYSVKSVLVVLGQPCLIHSIYMIGAEAVTSFAEQKSHANKAFSKSTASVLRPKTAQQQPKAASTFYEQKEKSEGKLKTEPSDDKGIDELEETKKPGINDQKQEEVTNALAKPWTAYETTLIYFCLCGDRVCIPQEMFPRNIDNAAEGRILLLIKGFRVSATPDTRYANTLINAGFDLSAKRNARMDAAIAHELAAYATCDMGRFSRYTEMIQVADDLGTSAQGFYAHLEANKKSANWAYTPMYQGQPQALIGLSCDIEDPKKRAKTLSLMSGICVAMFNPNDTASLGIRKLCWMLAKINREVRRDDHPRALIAHGGVYLVKMVLNALSTTAFQRVPDHILHVCSNYLDTASGDLLTPSDSANLNVYLLCAVKIFELGLRAALSGNPPSDHVDKVCEECLYQVLLKIRLVHGLKPFIQDTISKLLKDDLRDLGLSGKLHMETKRKLLNYLASCVVGGNGPLIHFPSYELLDSIYNIAMQE